MPKISVKTKKSFNFPSVDVVEASAGSGKTYALAKRYVQLILNPNLKTEDIPLKSVLAVTFTNKATIEMKQRILEFLRRIAFDVFPTEHQRQDILSLLVVDEAIARKMAYEIMDEIVSSYNLFQVQTIDSFINTLLKGCSFYLGFASNFRIREDHHAYLEYSLDRLIDKVHSNRKILNVFEEFLGYYLFVENKDGWFSKQDILELIGTLYSYSNTYGGMFLKPDVKVKDVVKKKKAVIELIKKLRGYAPDTTHKSFIKALDTFLEKNKDGFSIDAISTFFTRDDFPVNKGTLVLKKISNLWADIRKNLQELCDWESFAVFGPYIDIFDLANDEFRKLAGADDVIFLNELNVHAQKLAVGKEVTVPEVYYRLATRLHHYMIDEFQDTSKLQWRNIAPMVSEALSSGGSLFYVGDKKQAIFRFRGGDVSLFDSIQSDLSNYNFIETVLAKNYRSQKEIVEFNNEIFSEDNIRKFITKTNAAAKDGFEFSEGDVGQILSVFSDSKQEHKDENKHGYVEVKAVVASTVDDRNIIMREKLISLIRDLESRFGFGDIAILARENKNIKLFTSWLIEENIPVESERTLNIREHALIKELISFLKFLNSPIDDLSFASFILGDIFRKTAGIERDDIIDFLFNIRLSPRKDRGIYLYREFKECFPDAWNGLIDEFFKSVGFAPLYELMVSIFSKFKVVENFPEYQGFFMRLLELIKKKEDDYSGISSFLEFFEEIEEKDLFVNVTNTDSVKIQSIHKSKGLEFPVVIIPFLEIDVTVGSGGAGKRKPYVIRQSAEDNSLRLMQLKKKYGGFSRRLGEEYKSEYVKALIDELNVLYVSLTRAMHELYVFIPKVGKKNNLAIDFIPYNAHTRGFKRKYKKSKEADERLLMTLPVSKYSDWIGVLKDEFTGPLQLMRRDSLIRGSVIHFMLSCIGNLHADDRGACLRVAQARAELAFPHEKKLSEYMSIVSDVLKDEKFKPFFYIKDGTIYQEKEIADSYGNRKVLDRLIITPSEAWIVDYKSSKDESGAQIEQVTEYMMIVKALYPKLKIKGFLIYLDTMAIEEV